MANINPDTTAGSGRTFGQPTWCDTASVATKADLSSYEGVGRYINFVSGSHNDLTGAEKDALFAAGKKIFVYWQNGKGESLIGFDGGVAVAKEANRQMDAKGFPKELPIVYVGNDNNITTDQLKDYFRGLMSVPGRPVGGYGDFDDIEYLATLPGISTLVQTLAWSGDRVSSEANLYQRAPIASGSTTVDPLVVIKPFLAWSSTGVQMTYPDLTADAPFTQASKTSAGSNLPITRLVVHHTVSKTQAGGAQATANGFALSTAGGSAHYTVDPESVVQSVREAVIAWHAPPNPKSIGVEMTDFCVWVPYSGTTAAKLDNRFTDEASFHARWSRNEWQRMLARTALVFRALADKYQVPLVRLSVADVKAGKRGICGHREVSFAFGQSSHIDPYACDQCSGDFPWDQFMDLVIHPEKAVAILGGATTQEDDMPTPQDLLNAPVKREGFGGADAGTTSLGATIAWLDANFDGIRALINAQANPQEVHDALAEVLRAPEFNQDSLVAKLAEKIADLPGGADIDAIKKALADVLATEVVNVKVSVDPGTQQVQLSPEALSAAHLVSQVPSSMGEAREAAGVPDQETAPSVHGAFDTESLEG